MFITHQCSTVERGGCFQWHLFVSFFVCQHDNLRTIKHTMNRNLVVRCTVQKSRQSLS